MFVKESQIKKLVLKIKSDFPQIFKHEEMIVQFRGEKDSLKITRMIQEKLIFVGLGNAIVRVLEDEDIVIINKVLVE